ncbi:MAG: phage tail sheath subtilisin-like domain-containing protein, partial [Cyclobacteriaceae bacterium]
MASYKTPGVYIEEKNAFPNSVVAVETAVPAFIGYTEKAVKLGKTVFNKPIRVTSMVEFEQFFGGPPTYQFEVVPSTDTDNTANPPVLGDKEFFSLTVGGKSVNHKVVWKTDSLYRLHNCVKHFYQNGGGNCWIVAVGKYLKDDGSPNPLDKDAMIKAVAALADEPEPTMVLAPDALGLPPAGCYSVYQTILKHCKDMMSRIGVLDVPGGDSEVAYDAREQIEAFRTGVGTNNLDYGAAYFPWMETNVVSDREITFFNFDLAGLEPLLLTGNENIDAAIKRAMLTVKMPDDDTASPPEWKKGDYKITVSENGADVEKYVKEAGLSTVDAGLRAMLPIYKDVIVKEAVKKVNLLPPASAMAGIYTAVDNTRGVWKAPANVSMNSVIAPSYNVNNDLNDELNMPLNGKAVNPIRAFPGQGSIVWGARTLDGNSQDWRYINVRRTMIFLEMSVKAAARAYVFEPNDANTWVLVS